MIDIELYWNGGGYGVAYSCTSKLFTMEKYLIDKGYVIYKVCEGEFDIYIHFYDPAKAKREEDE